MLFPCAFSPKSPIFCRIIIFDLCFYFSSGLPYFKPGRELIMSKSAYAFSLKTLGGVFKTKSQASIGGSVSGHQEGEGKSAVNPGTEPILGGREVEAATQDALDSPPKCPLKGKKNVWTKPSRPDNTVVDEEEDAEEMEGLEGRVRTSAGGPDRVGNYTVTEVPKLMSGTPAESDWAEIERSGLNSIMQKCAEH